MSFTTTLMNGEQNAFKPESMTTMQRITLRFVVVGLIYFGLAALEGMLMRIYEVSPIPGIDGGHFFAMMTVHPLVGIFGSTYMIVFGAFLFLVPFLMNKPLWSIKLAHWTFYLITFGTLTMWTAGFISHYAPLYTLYWPLPADTTQFSALGGSVFILGIAVIMIGTMLYVVNIFKTIVYTPTGMPKQPAGALIASALGVGGLKNLFTKRKTEHLVSLPVAAIARGTVLQVS
jgi:cytochrome c oxidase subunit 1